MITIELVDNGILLSWTEEEAKRRVVFEYNDEVDEWGRHKAWLGLFWRLLEEWGPLGSKHDEFRLNIELKRQG